MVHFRTLRNIEATHCVARGIVRQAWVYWGPTRTGKSRRAWEQAGEDAFGKDPKSKFWFGYRGQKNVIFDEFRGGIDIAHILRWLDRYPVYVEQKGYHVPLVAEKIWFTSNVDPRNWWPDIDQDTREAFLKRVKIVHFPSTVFAE